MYEKDIIFCGHKESSIDFFDYNEKLRNAVLNSLYKKQAINLKDFSEEEIISAFENMYVSYKVAIETISDLIKKNEKLKEKILQDQIEECHKRR